MLSHVYHSVWLLQAVLVLSSRLVGLRQLSLNCGPLLDGLCLGHATFAQIICDTKVYRLQAKRPSFILLRGESECFTRGTSGAATNALASFRLHVDLLGLILLRWRLQRRIGLDRGQTLLADFLETQAATSHCAIRFGNLDVDRR